MQALQERNLPTGWISTELQNCVDILDGRRVPINARERGKRQGEIPYYGATGQVGWINDFLFDEELLLLGEDGAPFFDPSKNKAYMIRGKSWVNNHAHVLRAITSITTNSYLCYYLNIFPYNGYVSGTTRPKLNQAPMRRIPVPLAPLNEQKRIVNKIEELFTKLDAGIEYLKKARIILKRYRHSVLKAAFEGKLTEEWREKNGNQKETDWRKICLGEAITLEYGKGLIEEKRHSDGRIPVYGSNGMIDHHDAALSKGPTLIIGRKGAYRGAVHFSKEPCWAIDTAYFLEPKEGTDILFLFHFLTSLGLGALDKSSAIPGLNRNDVYRLQVELPSLNEQIEIGKRIETIFSLMNNLEEIIVNSLRQSERLRQSILSLAFQGKLVGQDGNDESAQKLLKRIKEQNSKHKLVAQ